MICKKSLRGLTRETRSVFVASTCADKATMAVAWSDNRIALLRAGLGVADCHDAIINAPAKPAVSLLGPGLKPPVPYLNCAAQ